MAWCDYQHCAVCDGKTFYDANIDWEGQRKCQVLSLCKECASKWEVVLRDRDTRALRVVELFDNFGEESDE